MSAPIFDPTLPADHSDAVSGVLRDQFNSLNEHCSQLDENCESRCFKPSGVALLATGISSPPTKAQVEELRDKINELITALNT